MLRKQWPRRRREAGGIDQDIRVERGNRLGGRNVEKRRQDPLRHPGRQGVARRAGAGDGHRESIRREIRYRIDRGGIVAHPGREHEHARRGARGAARPHQRHGRCHRRGAQQPMAHRDFVRGSPVEPRHGNRNPPQRLDVGRCVASRAHRRQHRCLLLRRVSGGCIGGVFRRERNKEQRHSRQEFSRTGEARDERAAFRRRRRAVQREGKRARQCRHACKRGLAPERGIDGGRKRRIGGRAVVHHPRDGGDQLGACIAGCERKHLLRRGARRRGVTGCKQRFGERLPRGEKCGDETRGLAPCGKRVLRAPELPEHLAQLEVRIGRTGIGADRAAKAQHGVDRPAFPLVGASARDPFGAFGRCTHAFCSAVRARAHSNGRRNAERAPPEAIARS